jgi:hypothetical protein
MFKNRLNLFSKFVQLVFVTMWIKNFSSTILLVRHILTFHIGEYSLFVCFFILIFFGGLWGWGFFVLFFSQFSYVASLVNYLQKKKKKKTLISNKFLKYYWNWRKSLKHCYKTKNCLKIWQIYLWQKKSQHFGKFFWSKKTHGIFKIL